MVLLAFAAVLLGVVALSPLAFLGVALRRWFWPAEAQALEEDRAAGEIATLLELAAASRPG